MPYYQDEQTARAEAAVQAFLQTEVEAGRVSQDEAGNWTWNVNEFAWPLEVSTDPSILDGQIAAGYGECSAYEPCDADNDYMCDCHTYAEMEI